MSPLPVVPSTGSKSSRNALIALWIIIFAVIPIWAALDDSAWDVKIYATAMHYLHAGQDPYAEATAIQRAYHAAHDFRSPDKLVAPPYSYVYSPITLPVLRLIAALPFRFSGIAYWALYILAVLAQLWAAVQVTSPSERRIFLFLAPIAPFFPGFLENGTLLSGNIAYILYALVLLAAIRGWRTSDWRWFYAAVLGASCVKAPLLSLIVIPILSARRQWIPAAVTATAGIALFAVQPLLWPSLFRHYLDAVELQFSFNRDFGCSPAGLFSAVLFDHGIPYSPASLIFYTAYAIPLFGLMIYLSRRYFAGCFTLFDWAPVLLVGVILLNPRLIEYDVAPIALPLALIAWRFIRHFALTTGRTIAILLGVFVVTNVIAATNWETRKLVDGPLLVLFFGAGCWLLLRNPTHPLDPHNPQTFEAL